MAILGVSLSLIVVFVGFGLLIGTLFGFFGMGGFLVTPALLILGYHAQVAVGSGLAFLFGTSVIGALRHRDHGQIDYKLAAIITVTMIVGVDVGKQVVVTLDSLGLADLFVGIAYVGLLAAVGFLTLRDAQSDAEESAEFDYSEAVEAITVPPMVTLGNGVRVSVFVVGTIGLGVGIASGTLGVGGGFLLMPAMMYGLGVPAAVAVGTDLVQITISAGYGAFTYAQIGAVATPAVAAMLAGSALGARIGAGATTMVDEDDIKGYFAAMLLTGSVAVALKKVAVATGIGLLNTASIVLIFGAAIVVSGAVVLSAVCCLRDNRTGAWCRFVSA